MCWRLNKFQYVFIQEGGLSFISKICKENKTGDFFHVDNEGIRNLHDIIILIKYHDMRGNFPINNSYWLVYKGGESVFLCDIEERQHFFKFEAESWETYINLVHDEILHLKL